MSEWKIAKIRQFLKSPEGEFLLNSLLDLTTAYQSTRISDMSYTFTQHKDIAWEAYITAHRQLGMLMIIDHMKTFGNEK